MMHRLYILVKSYFLETLPVINLCGDRLDHMTLTSLGPAPPITTLIGPAAAPIRSKVVKHTECATKRQVILGALRIL